MNNLRRVYLSLGGNLGNRLFYLRSACKELQQQAGSIVAYSSIYETPAWKFSGFDFLNACVAIDTQLHPQELLDVILNIEEKLGRKRNKESGYQSRTMDIDILYYENEIVNASELKIPHPYIQDRKFVLQPLLQIAPDFVHPVLKKNTGELLEICKDHSVPIRTEFELLSRREDNFSSFNFIAIEGNIGAGKTTLATKIADDFNGKLILERFADNPFLPKFYKDQQRYAFPLEMSFLADRYQQFSDDTSQLDLFKNFMVSDYDIFKSLIFAKVTLQEEEFKLYRKVFNFMYNEVVKPDVYVYLYQSTERLLENIRKRGRSYEQNIPADYLDNINRSYFNFIKSYKDLNALVIDITDMDFVKNPLDYDHIISKIHEFYDKKTR